MPNTIKYSTGSETLALKKGNFYIGTGDVGKGPTESTGYWNGISPPTSGYTIYLSKETQGPSAYVAPTDNDLITTTNQISGQNYTGVTECLTYFAGQTDKMVLNADYPTIVTNGLVLNLDAGFVPSYPRSGTTWSDLSVNGYTGTLTNGPTYSSDVGGTIVFDGADDYVNLGSFQSLRNNFTAIVWCKLNTTGFNILGFYNTSSPFNGWGLGYNQSPRDGGFLNFWDGGSWKNPNIIVNDNTWKQIAVVVSSSYLLSFYINGIFSTSIQGTTINSFTGSKAIGARNDSLGPMSGNITQTMIYNRALTSEEITQNYNATKSRFGL